MSRVLRIVARVVRWSLIATGALAIALAVWLASGRHTPVEHFVQESNPPGRAAAIICVAGGLGPHLLPTEEGWHRIYTAVQLLSDGFASTIVFSGGGVDNLSEAEVYAEAARWLGAPAEAIVLDPMPASTAEHPRNLLALKQVRLTRDTPLLVVTSPLHSKRTSMVFRKAGFTRLRTVTSHEAASPAAARSARTSALPSFEPNNKSYGDPLNQLRWRFNDFIVALRELGALAAYRRAGLV
jgi:uncharacterized SAM-binding protein YcdF (DUF218 family)